MSLEDFDYGNKVIMDEIYAAMNATDFTGVSVSHVTVLAACFSISLDSLPYIVYYICIHA